MAHNLKLVILLRSKRHAHKPKTKSLALTVTFMVG